MSNARDKANIPALNFSSTGIDDNATSTAITIDSSERVGINTTSQGSLYGGANNLVVGGGSANAGMSIYTGTSNVGRLFFADGTSGSARYSGFLEYNHSNDGLQIGVNGSTKIKVDSSGNVGIGTTNPAFSAGKGLRIENSGTATLRLQDAGVHGFEIRASSTEAEFSSANAKPFTFDTGGSERMRIDSSGNVGIGTSSPSNKLDVVSGALTNSFDSSFYGLKIVNSTTNPARINLQNSQGTAVIDANNNLLRFRGSGGADDMVIDSSGNVGIGTSSPSASYKLDVSGAIRGTALRVYDTTPSLIIHSSNSALGTNDSIGQLTFNTSDSTTPGGGGIVSTIETYSTTTNGSDYALKISKREGSGGGECSINMGGSSTGSISFGTNTSGNATTRMTIAKDGKVGINTTSPYGKFEVHSGGGGTNYTGSSAIKSGVTWGSEASSHTIDLWNYNEADNTSGMLLVHAKADSSKCGTLMLLFTKRVGQTVKITTVSSKLDGMSTFSASTSANDIIISTDSDCAICWQSYYGV